MNVILNSLSTPFPQDQTLEEQVEAFTEALLKDLMATDSLLASHCDLAVMRCLFSPEWSEAGAFWALQYIYRRLAYLRHERLREKAASDAQTRFQRFRSKLPEAYLYGDAVTSQGADFGVLRSLSMPQLVIAEGSQSSDSQDGRGFSKDNERNSAAGKN